MAELIIPAKKDELDNLQAFVEGQLEAYDCPAKVKFQIALVVEEIFVNIASYSGLPEDGTVTIRMETGGDPLTIEMIFIDAGIEFDPLKKEDPDVTLPAEERQVGGLGIFLVKKTMDEVEYEYKDGKNILRMKKEVKPGEPKKRDKKA